MGSGFDLGFYFEFASIQSGASMMSSGSQPQGKRAIALDSFNFTNLTALKMSIMNTGELAAHD